MQTEFNTNHPDKEERKKARRKRIEKRHEEAKRDLGEGSGSEQHGVNRTGAQQVSDSLLHLDRRKHVGLSEITDMRVKTDINEANRRTEEENMKKDRLGKMQQEAFGAAKG